MTDLDVLARQLHRARQTATTIASEHFPVLSVPEAYAVQDRLSSLTVEQGGEVIGWKVGLTSTPAMSAFAAQEPIIGRIFADSLLPSGATLPVGRACEPRVEGELLLVLGERPAPPCDDATLLSSIAAICPAIEVADSRLEGWARAAAPAIADDACCGWVVAGERSGLAGRDLAAIEMRLSSNDIERSTGVGTDCLGSPLNVYRWFVEKAEYLGLPVRPGHLLLTGAMGRPIPAVPADRYRAALTGIGEAVFAFGGFSAVRP